MSKRVEVWWRCRESNPGPTCDTVACTVVLFSVLASRAEKSQRPEASDDAKDTCLSATSGGEEAPLVTPHSP